MFLVSQGACKSFDAAANGYARSDGIAIVVLRKAGMGAEIGTWAARSPYARVLACATNNDGHTKEGITFPSGPAQRALAQEVRARCLLWCAVPQAAPAAVALAGTSCCWVSDLFGLQAALCACRFLGAAMPCCCAPARAMTDWCRNLHQAVCHASTQLNHVGREAGLEP